MNIHDIISVIPAHSAKQASVALAVLLKAHGEGPEHLYGDALTLTGDTGQEVGIGHYAVKVTFAAGPVISEPMDYLDVHVGIQTMSGHTVDISASVLADGTVVDVCNHPWPCGVVIGSEESLYFYPEVKQCLGQFGINAELMGEGPSLPC